MFVEDLECLSTNSDVLSQTLKFFDIFEVPSRTLMFFSNLQSSSKNFDVRATAVKFVEHLHSSHGICLVLREPSVFPGEQ